MAFEFHYVVASFKMAVRYIPVTLMLSGIPLLVGMVLGTFIAIGRRFQIAGLDRAGRFLIPVIKGVPLVLHVLIMNFLILKPLDYLAKWYHWADKLRFMDKIYIGIVAISIYAVIHIAEIMRSALNSVDKAQYEACYALGMTRWQALRRVILPQAFPFAVPVLCNHFIGLIKGSSVVYLITVVDVMNGALISAQTNYRFLEAYIAAALIYWTICLAVEKISSSLETHLKKYRYKEVIYESEV